MAFEVLQLSLIVARLNDQVSAFKSIEGALDFEKQLKSGVRKAPAGFVMPLKEDAAGNRIAANAVRQKITDRFAIVYAVKNLSDATGAAGIDGGLRDLRMATKTALVGWVPGAGFNICTEDGGSLIAIENGTIWWRDRFITSHNNSTV